MNGMMASLVFRCILLGLFIYFYFHLLSCFHLLPSLTHQRTYNSLLWPNLSPVQTDVSVLPDDQYPSLRECTGYQELEKLAAPMAESVNLTLVNQDGHQKHIFYGQTSFHGDEKTLDSVICQSSAHASSSISSMLKSIFRLKNDLFHGSCVVVNALTVLDIALSRRTKPWRLFLRILYRITRSNLKWIVFWLAWVVLSHMDSVFFQEKIAKSLVQLVSTDVGLQMQSVWIAIQSYPALSCLAYLLYSFLVSWLLRRIVPRHGAPEEGDESLQSRDQSRFSLLLDCLFLPISLRTANNLNDFEMDDGMEFLIAHLALPNLWLTPVVPVDYLNYLPIWSFNGWTSGSHSNSSNQNVKTDKTINGNAPVPSVVKCKGEVMTYPSGMIPSCECAICLDKYQQNISLCGLPCGHHFHRDCIMIWLKRDHHHCPICRWPAYRNKGPAANA